MYKKKVYKALYINHSCTLKNQSSLFAHRVKKMNKILFYIVLFATLLSFAHQASALPLDPLNLGKTAKKLLSKLGIATYYDVEAGVGSCGLQSKHTQKVVAVNQSQMKNGNFFLFQFIIAICNTKYLLLIYRCQSQQKPQVWATS